MKIRIVALSAVLLLGSTGCLLMTGCQKDYDGQLEVLRNQLKNGAVDLSQLKDKTDLMQEQIDKLEEALKQSDQTHQAEISQLVQDLKALKQELLAQTADLQSQIDEAKTGIENLKDQVKSVEAAFNARLTDLSARIDAVDASLNLLDGRVSKLEEQVLALNEKQGLVDEAVKGLKEEIKLLKERPQTPDVTDQVNRLEAALLEMQTLGQDLQKQVAALGQMMEEVRKSAADKDGELDGLISQTAQDLVALQNRVDGQIQELSSRLTGLSDALSALGNSIAAVNVKYNELDSRVEDLRIDFKAQIDKIWETINDGTAPDVSGLEETVAQLQASLNRFNAEVEQSMVEVLQRQNLFGNRLQEMSETLEAYQKNLQELTRQLEDLDLRVTDVEKWISDFETAYDVTLQEIKRQLGQLSDTHSQNSDEINLLKAQLQQMESDFRQQSAALGNLKKDQKAMSELFFQYKKDMDNKLLAIDANFTRLLERLDETDKKLGQFTETFNNRLTQLNADFGSLTAKVNANSASILRLQQQLDSLENNVNNRLDNYYTKEKVEKLLKDYQEEVNQTFEGVFTQLSQKLNKSEVETLIEEANKVINSQIAAMQQEMAEMNTRIDKLEEQIKMLIARVQSMQLIPDYSNGAVKVVHDLATNRVRLTLRVKVNPSSCVQEIVRNKGCISIDLQPVVPVKAVTDNPVFDIDKVAERDNGILEVQVSAQSFINPSAADQDLPFQIAVSLKNGKDDRTSNYATMRFSTSPVKDQDVEYHFYMEGQSEPLYTRTDISLSQFPESGRLMLNALVNKSANGTRVCQLPEYPVHLFDRPVKGSPQSGTSGQYAVKYSYTMAYDKNDVPVSSMENFIGVTTDGNIYMKANLNPVLTQHRSLEDFKIIVGLQSFDGKAIYGKTSYICVQLKKQ